MAPFAQRPFRTVVSAPITQLLESYNAAAEQLRPSVAQIFNVPELAGLQRHATAADSPQGWPALLKQIACASVTFAVAVRKAAVVSGSSVNYDTESLRQTCAT